MQHSQKKGINMKKILLTAVLLSLGSFNLQADENHYKDDKHMEHSHQHKDKDKGKKRFDRSFLEHKPGAFSHALAVSQA